ncbi:Josephin-like protein [Rhynchospora pubera]|uniref:ubiquitinyl hydrolase 1 n=1 Tax=Rhynchospora pubera TaxID=906938 RepID=A0AAV8HCK4_9POAL|nr:Josephin-like protein [Rhynchospora pubera]
MERGNRESLSSSAAASASSQAQPQPQPQGLFLYHERQRLQLCLLHALNNLFQDKDAFTRADLDTIARQLQLHHPPQQKDHKWWILPLPSLVFKPHHNALTGNYDVNVLIAALEGSTHQKKVVWHDRRTPAASIDLAACHLMGIMLNTSVPRLRGFWTSRHWTALRNIRGVWYNLDSDLPAPQPFRHETHLVSFLDNTVAQGGEIFLIFNQD